MSDVGSANNQLEIAALPLITRNLLQGATLLFVGSLLLVVASVFPGGNQFFYENHLIGFVVGFASLAAMSGSSYYFGKESGVTDRIIFAAGAPALTFVLLVEAAYTLTGGYHGTGGGAFFMFLLVPAFIFILGAIFALIGGSKKRAVEKRETGYTANKASGS